MVKITILMFIVSTSLSIIYANLELIPEKASMTYKNTKYFANATLQVRRYARRAPYYINFFGTTKMRFTNNITVHIEVLEYLHNEYRPSFIEIHSKFCDLLQTDKFFGGTMKKAGVICPLPAGDFKYMNVTADTKGFRYKMPFVKGRMMFTITQSVTKELMGTAYVDFLIKQNIKYEHDK